MRKNRATYIRHFYLANTLARAFCVPPSLRIALYSRSGITIGANSYIFAGVVFKPGKIAIGSDCYINYGCMIDPGVASISIGDHVALGPQVILVGNTHVIGPAWSRAGRPVSADIRIGNGCWLGAGVIVMPGVSIAAGCIIGAGSLVTKDTDINGVYVGSPARRIRTISNDGLASLPETADG